MKPDFALSLSFDGISLLSRGQDGWLRVGEAALDTTDLGPELTNLQRQAQAIAGDDVRCKLVIPPEQIKFLSIPEPDNTADTRAVIEAALDGVTPYAVDDLVFDWQVDNGMLRIAAVARETLDEAEGFAAMYGFGPASFVANPQEQFPTEVFFGPTETGEALGVERDTTPIRVTGVYKAPRAEPAEDVAEPQTSEMPVEAEQRPVQVDGPAADEPSEPERGEDDGGQSETPEPAPVFASMRQHGVTAEPDTEKASPQDTATEDQVASDGAAGQADTMVEGPTQPVETQIIAAVEPAAPRMPAGEPQTAQPAEPADSGSALDKVKGAAGALPFFGSRRKRGEPAARAEPSPPQSPTAVAPTGHFTSMRATRDAAGEHAPRLAGANRETARLTDGQMPVPGRTPEPLREETPRIEHVPQPPAFQAADPIEEPIAEPSQQPPKKRGLGWRRKPRPDPKAEAARAKERDRMTVFGARAKADVGGKPRFLGLMLTAALLVFLAGVAAWASIFVDDGLARFFSREDSPTDIALSPDEFEELSLADGGIAAPPQGQSPEVVVASLGPAPDAPGVLERGSSAVRSQPNLQVTGEALDPAEAEARYAASGIWQMSPDEPSSAEPISLEDIYVASIDQTVQAHDAVALPQSRSFRTDAAMLPQRLPPAAGVRFSVDDRGLFVPSPDGVETPQGYTLFAGRPALLPRLRPGTGTETDRASVPLPNSDEQRAADAERTRLAAFRPRNRPGDLIEQSERGRLGGLSLAELSGIRPRLRPKSAQQQAEEAATDAAAVAEAVEEAQEVDIASAMAVAASRAPRTRPGNLARRFERLAQEPAATQVAAVAPRTVSPKIPSKATVARQATIKNAINLRKINLIGVYGKPSSRRALVRLSSGRYKKVKVGDRIDGGRVAAIGDSELRYTKGGRSVTLRMPRS